MKRSDREADLVYFNYNQEHRCGNKPAFDYIFEIKNNHHKPHFTSFRVGFDADHFNSIDDLVMEDYYDGGMFSAACSHFGIQDYIHFPKKHYDDCSCSNSKFDNMMKKFEDDLYWRVDQMRNYYPSFNDYLVDSLERTQPIDFEYDMDYSLGNNIIFGSKRP